MAYGDGSEKRGVCGEIMIMANISEENQRKKSNWHQQQYHQRKMKISAVVAAASRSENGINNGKNNGINVISTIKAYGSNNGVAAYQRHQQ